MCGICGLVGPAVTKFDIEDFQQLMYVNGLRGMHSTGMFTHTPAGQYKNERYRIHKEVIPAAIYLYKDSLKKDSESMFRSVMTEVFMAHSRYATAGAVNKENAHPFDTGRYVGTHNGTLVDKRFFHKEKTDSQMMFEEMERSSPAEVLKSLGWRDAWAVAMYDKETDEMILGTNGERPLNIMLSDNSRIMMYASELSALDFIKTRNKRRDLHLFSLKKDMLYRFKVSQLQMGKELKDWTVEEVKSTEYDWSTWSTEVEQLWEKHLAKEDNGKVETTEQEICCVCSEVIDPIMSDFCEVHRTAGIDYVTCPDCLQGISKSKANQSRHKNNDKRL